MPTVWDRQIRNAVDAGDGDYRLRVLREAVAAEPENIPARMELAKAYRDRGYPDVALEVCRLAAARFPESGEVATGAGAGAARDESAAGSDRRLEAFLKAHPQTDAGLLFLAGHSARRDRRLGGRRAGASPGGGTGAGGGRPAQQPGLQPADAEEERRGGRANFARALRLNPGSQLARNNLGLALANQNARQQAVANWQAVSDPATAHNNLAAVWMEEGNYPEARKELQTALSYNKSNSAALRNLELVSRLEGRPATMEAQPGETRWTRWKSGFKKLFVGPLEDSRTEPAKTASAPGTGEKR